VAARIQASQGKEMISHVRVTDRRAAGAAALILFLTCSGLIAPGLRTQASDDGLLAGLPISDYQARRKKLMERLTDGIVVLLGAREEDFGEVGRFRQNNNFMYLTGVETPGAFVMLWPPGLVPDKPAQEMLFLPQRNPLRERWTGPQIGPGAESQQRFGIQEVVDAERFYARVLDALSGPPFKSEGRSRGTGKLYTVVPRGSTAPITRENIFLDLIRRAAPHVQIQDVTPIIAEMRKIKSDSEVALLKKAIDITGEAHVDAARQLKPGVYEYEAQAALEAAFTRNGAQRPGFPSIVGSGFYSTVLHYNENRRRMEAGDLVVIDIGAEYNFYTADMTRTYPVSGKFSQRQREIYQLVLDAQVAAEKAFQPGKMTMDQLRQVSVDVMRKSPLRDKQGATLDRHFIHGLGHWLGMDVHDVGDYSIPIPVGSVITIEPGIYIPEESLGVRIEDDYLVTDGGLVKLSAKTPSSLEDIERLMRRR
jgi:Xaa-Pro aminopeptidase